MNHLLVLVVLAVVYIVIGIASAIRSHGYAKRFGSPVVHNKVVVGLIGTATVIGWPLSEICQRIILKQCFPHLLPPKKVKPPTALERIAQAIEGLSESIGQTLRNAQSEAENLRQRIAGLEQSLRDVRANSDRIREERDTANGRFAEMQSNCASLELALHNAHAEIARLKAPPAPPVAPATPPA